MPDSDRQLVGAGRVGHISGAGHIGGAGGVGSIAIQLLRALTDLEVIATASRPETQAWVKELGAHHVVDHTKPLAAQVAAIGIGAPGFVFSTTHTGSYVGEIAELIAPQGRFGLIDDPEALDVMPFKTKCISTHWELMFTRSLFQTADMARQGEILNEVAGLVDAGRVRSTATETLGVINAANLKRDRTFTGQKADSTGLMYFNARYYDPSLGQFLSPDTLVPDAGLVLDDNRI